MPFNSRDLWIILRARDLTSQTLIGVGKQFGGLGRHATRLDRQFYAVGQRLEQVGRIATTAGIGITALGIGGLIGIKKLADASMEFEKSAALAATQVHNGQVSVKQLEQISINVAKVIPVPIESLNAALFDIFSSTDIKVKDSAKVLLQFSRAAVAGQDDIISVGRTAIAILNSWDLPLSSLTHIFDVQFKMVQLGVGTYKQFAGVLGRAIPSVRATGQSFEFLAGTMAFLTRRGQSVAMAAVGIARLSDMFRRADTVQGLKDIGKEAIKAAKFIGQKLAPDTIKWLKGFSINLLDAHGKMRPINTLLTEMAPAFAKLQAPARAGLFKDVFGAQGTIQARRFFDLAIDHTKQLNQFIRDVGNSAGATKKAYTTMAQTFAAKSQLLKNNWQILKIELGNELIPILSRFITQLTKVVQWFVNLSPHTKKLIGYFLLFASVMAIVGGIMLTIIGVFAMLVGSIAVVIGSIGAGLAGAIAIVAGLTVVVIIAIIALTIVIIKYHKAIWAFMVRIWRDIVTFVIRIWNDIKTFFIRIWNDIATFAVRIWDDVAKFFTDLWHSAQDIAEGVWNSIVSFLKDRWEFAKKTTVDAWNAVLGFLKAVWKIIRIAFAVFLALLLLPWTTLWSVFGKQLTAAWHSFVATLKLVWKIIADFFKAQWAVAVVLWRNLWESFKIIGAAFWRAINTSFRFVWLQIKRFFLDQWAVFVVLWKNLWESFRIVGMAFWRAINTAFRFVWGQIKTFFTSQWDIIKTLWKNLWESFRILAKQGWGTISRLVKGAWKLIMDFFKNQLTPFKTIWKNLVESFRIIWNSIKGIFSGPVNWVISHVLNPFIRTLDRISKKLGVGLNIPEIPLLGGGGTQRGTSGSGRRVAAGGMVRGLGGPRADLINAWLSNGEFVVNAAATSRHRQLLEAINANQFASGGIVGAVTDPIGTAVNVALHRLPGGDVVHRLISGLAHKFISAIAGAAEQKLGSITQGVGIAFGINQKFKSVKDLAYQMIVQAFGISQWRPFDLLEMREAGYNVHATNPSSGAYGIPQALPASKLPRAAFSSDVMTAAFAQLAWMIQYIRGRYGTPAGAWAHEVAHNWYDRGGYLPPGVSIAVNRTGKPERVLPPDKSGVTQIFNIQTQEINPVYHAQRLGWEIANRG
jgi:TP901 family phage tail tape measure protein